MRNADRARVRRLAERRYVAEYRPAWCPVWLRISHRHRDGRAWSFTERWHADHAIWRWRQPQ
jgi:hypothetical protein